MKGDVLDGTSGAKSLSTASWAANVGIRVNDALPKGTRERRFLLCEFTKLFYLNVSSLVAKAKESNPQSWWEQSGSRHKSLVLSFFSKISSKLKL